MTNAFLVATSDPLAILHNDIAVLESHHLATLFRLLQTRPHCNVFARCDRETMKGVRKLIIEAVLSTDMARHFPMVTKAQVFAELNRETLTQAARGDADAHRRLRSSADDKLFVVGLFLHAADISNPARPKHLQDRWAEAVLREFFEQGDRERELGLPISPGFDRRTTTLAISQVNFSEFVRGGPADRPLSREETVVLCRCAWRGWPPITECSAPSQVVMPLYAALVQIFPVRFSLDRRSAAVAASRSHYSPALAWPPHPQA